jgi:hypothetical protein
MCNEKDSNCIAEILRVISVLQQNACGDSCLDSCDRPMLGGGPTCLICNTRPVMIYTCGGGNEPWSMPITKDSTAVCTGESDTCSVVFRVEKVDGNCCTFRVLQDNPDTTSLYPYVSTNSVFTINLDCICVLRCLTDTYVDCV